MSLKEKAQTISYVSTETVYSQHIRVNELIAMGRFPYTGWLGRMKISDKRAIQEAVKLTGISHLLYKPIGQLSDGERQKVMIARALAQDTPVVILDEPTAFLDLPARYEILRLLSGITLRENKTILFSTHDLSVALDIADKIWLMADNDIYQGAPEDLLISKVFRKLFLNSPAEFDLKSSTFRFKREYTGSVVVHGDNKYKLLTKRAMERIGFQTTEDEPEIVVHIICEHDQPCWQLIDGDHIIRFHSVYTLTSYLKNRTC